MSMGRSSKRHKAVNRLIYYRDKLNLSKDEVAAEFGISEKTLERYENGKSLPTIDIAMGLAKLYGVPIYDLFEVTIKEEYRNA